MQTTRNETKPQALIAACTATTIILSVMIIASGLLQDFAAARDAALAPLAMLLSVSIAGLVWSARREWLARIHAEREAMQSAAACQATVQRLNALFQHAPDALQIVAVNDGGRFAWEMASPPFLALYGVELAQIIGKDPRDCFPAPMAERMVGHWQSCIDTRQAHVFQHCTLERGARIDLEKCISPVCDEHGRVVRLVGVIRDVTERNQMERNLRQAQKMEIVGQLTAGVAHGFNNLLQATIGSIDLLESHIDSTDEAQHCLSVVRKASLRGMALTSRLLTVSRRQDLDPALTTAEEVFSELQEFCEGTLGTRVAMDFQDAKGIWPLLVDSSQLMSCLINLAVNARDAMPLGGVITVSAANSAEGDADRPAGLKGDFVRIAVADTGFGMSAGTLARACDPFFTTKEAGKGSGLGLSMVQGFVAQSGGSMTIKSEPDRGTVVELWLPRLHAAVLAAAPERPQVPADRFRRVLLVDDDPEVSAVLGMMLARGGYAIVQAGSGEEAIATLAMRGPFDLLVSDSAMSGMSGEELIAAAMRSYPAMPSLLITGYHQSTSLDGCLPAGVRVLRKPIRQDDLLRQVRAALADHDHQAQSPADNVFRFPDRFARVE